MNVFGKIFVTSKQRKRLSFWTAIFLCSVSFQDSQEERTGLLRESSVFLDLFLLQAVSLFARILPMIVVSSLEKTGGFFSLGSGSPSLTIITRFWQLAHQRSPLFSLKIGEEQAGHACSVRVAPCLSKSAIILMFSEFLATSNLF